MDNALVQIYALVLKDGKVLPAILIFVLLHAAIIANALIQIRARVILDAMAVPAMDSAVLLHAVVNALVQIRALVILDTLVISAMLATVYYARMEESARIRQWLREWTMLHTKYMHLWRWMDRGQL